MLDGEQYTRAVAERWVFLVPVELNTQHLSGTFLRRHVLRPTDASAGHYETIETPPATVHVEEGHVALDGDCAVEILYTETYYDEEYNSLRIVNVSDYLGTDFAGRLQLSSSAAAVSAASSAASSILPVFASAAEAEAVLETAAPGLAAEAQRLRGQLASTLAAAGRRGTGRATRGLAVLGSQLGTAASALAARAQSQGGLSRTRALAAAEAALLEPLHTGLLDLLALLHADHDAALALAANRQPSAVTAAALSDHMRPCLVGAGAALAALPAARTPAAKLAALQACVAAIARQARHAKSSEPELEHIVPPVESSKSQLKLQLEPSIDGPERPLSLTADELLPVLIAVIQACPVPSLSAHFALIQFRQDRSSELAYYLTTVRAALEFIRDAPLPSGPELQGPAEGAALFAAVLASPSSPSSSPSSVPAPGSAAALLEPSALLADLKAGPDRLEVRDRWWRLGRYPQCFIASELIDWLVLHRSLPRPQALLFARHLVLRGRIVHSSDPYRQLEDAELFYRFSEPPVASSASLVVSSPTGPLDPAQLAWAMAHPVSGVPVADVTTQYRMLDRCFLPKAALAWLAHNRSLSASAARQTLLQLQDLGLLLNLTPSRPAPDSYLQFAPLSHPVEGPALCAIVRQARQDAALSRKSWPGLALVDWLVRNSPCKTRSEAVIVARKLQNAGLVKRLGNDGLFVDTPTAFHFA